jgi:hypothetical protein
MTVAIPLGLGLEGCGGFGRFALAAIVDLVDAIRTQRPPTAAGLEACESPTAIPAQKAADTGRMQELHQLHLTGVV